MTTNTEKGQPSVARSAPRKIAFWAAVVGGIASLGGNITLTLLTGSPNVDSILILLCWLASVALLATRIRWAPLVSTLLGGAILSLLLTQPDVIEHLTHPTGPNGGFGIFAGDVFVVACTLFLFGGSIAAAIWEARAFPQPVKSPKEQEAMTDQSDAQSAHPTLHAGHTGVVVSQLLDEDWTPTADPASNALTEAIDGVLHLTADLARRLIGAHQAAAALIVEGDWTSLRKYFSLSPRYAAWYDYRTPAVGFGIHADVVKQNAPIRLTQAELARHPDWRGFGTQAGAHPPMRGWLAVPLLGQDGRNHGLLQLSDKYDERDFTQEDEMQLTRLAQLTAKTLDAILRLHRE